MIGQFGNPIAICIHRDDRSGNDDLPLARSTYYSINRKQPTQHPPHPRKSHKVYLQHCQKHLPLSTNTTRTQGTHQSSRRHTRTIHRPPQNIQKLWLSATQ